MVTWYFASVLATPNNTEIWTLSTFVSGSLELWGYRRVEEVIWVKTNQLQRIIRTGRTGHWLNHSKEHCLVGIKGQPEVNRNIDTDVLVAEVRETSRKPDEVNMLDSKWLFFWIFMQPSVWCFLSVVNLLSDQRSFFLFFGSWLCNNWKCYLVDWSH